MGTELEFVLHTPIFLYTLNYFFYLLRYCHVIPPPFLPSPPTSLSLLFCFIAVAFRGLTVFLPVRMSRVSSNFCLSVCLVHVCTCTCTSGHACGGQRTILWSLLLSCVVQRSNSKFEWQVICPLNYHMGLTLFSFFFF